MRIDWIESQERQVEIALTSAVTIGLWVAPQEQIFPVYEAG
jgi:hypothetical protein